MLGQITKIDNVRVDLLRPVSNNEKIVMPSLNSLVEVRVLEVFENASKVLINGKLFYSKFPSANNPGDIFIARVLSHLPFTLSLSINEEKMRITEKEIAMLLSKFGFSNSPIGKKVLKAFLEEKKPIEKAKLESILEYLEKENIDPDELQLQFLLRASVNSDLREFKGSSQKWIFNKPIEALKTEILNSVNILLNSGSTSQLTEVLNQNLIIDLDCDEPVVNLLLNKKEIRIENILSSIDKINLDAISEQMVKNELAKLKISLYQFKILQDIYISTGVYPQLLIVKRYNEYQLLQYNFQKKSTITNEKNFHIELEVNPEHLNRVVINSILSNKNVMVDFHSTPKTLESLQSSKNELETNLLKKLNVSPLLKFSDQPTIPNATTKSIEGINVKF